MMGDGNTSEPAPNNAAQRGLWRLMLKLPAVRGRLQLISTRSASLEGLCEAYEDASVALERLRARSGASPDTLVEEYETICSEIENDVIKLCLDKRWGIPE
jgi:hypothetical protein